MCPEHSKIVVAVSGGADSISLLHYFHKNRLKYNWDIIAVHINHGMRGKDSDNDMNFVEKICKNWDIKLETFHYNVLIESKKLKLGTEETGRLLRYKALNKVAKSTGLIAVAHHQDDQAETVIMRLARGSNSKGLGGIRPINNNIIRPLLFVSREEIENYCDENNLDFTTDKTNYQLIYTRNKIRLDILPSLEKIYPQAKKHIAKAGFYLAEENQFLEELATEYYNKALVEKNKNQLIFQLETLRNTPLPLTRRIFIQAINHLGLEKNFTTKHIENILELLSSKNMKEITLPNNIFVKNSYETLIFSKDKEEIKSFYYNIPINQSVFIEEINISIKISTHETVNHEKNNQNATNDYTKVFDYDKIIEVFSKDFLKEIFCRNRKTGDKIPVKNGHKTLKTYLIDEKIPVEKRDAIPLIAYENIILWVIGYKASNNFLATEETKNPLTITVKQEETT